MNTPHTTTPTDSPYTQAPDDIFTPSPEPDSAWLMASVEAIDPHVFEQGKDGAYTRALERLAVQLRDELDIATTIAKVRITNTAGES